MAFHYMNIWQSAKDSLNSKEHDELIAEMAAKYEADKKESAIQILKKDKETQQAELERQATLRKALLGGLAGLVFFILFTRVK